MCDLFGCPSRGATKCSYLCLPRSFHTPCPALLSKRLRYQQLISVCFVPRQGGFRIGMQGCLYDTTQKKATELTRPRVRTTLTPSSGYQLASTMLGSWGFTKQSLVLNIMVEYPLQTRLCCEQRRTAHKYNHSKS